MILIRKLHILSILLVSIFNVDKSWVVLLDYLVIVGPLERVHRLQHLGAAIFHFFTHDLLHITVASTRICHTIEPLQIDSHGNGITFRSWNIWVEIDMRLQDMTLESAKYHGKLSCFPYLQVIMKTVPDRTEEKTTLWPSPPQIRQVRLALSIFRRCLIWIIYAAPSMRGVWRIANKVSGSKWGIL